MCVAIYEKMTGNLSSSKGFPTGFYGPYLVNSHE